MILNSRNNLFNFKFPRTFIPKEVADKYRQYLNRMPGNLITEPIDFVNYSIQGVNLPGVSFDPIQVSPNDGTITYHRGYGNIVVHNVRGDNSVSTTVTKYNRIEPLKGQFGVPLQHQLSTETTIAWADKRFF